MNPSEPRPRVFVSYARSDGEALAAELRRRLVESQVPVWRDREGTEGGLDWWHQITRALDEVEFLVLVVTPAGVQSSLVRREWRYARQRGVAVYPVLCAFDVAAAGTAAPRPEDLPPWLARKHCYELPLEWEKFIGHLHARPRQVRSPFMAEDLPADFVPRPAEAEQLLSLLLDPARQEPVAITTALRGAGGYGKTALARALCHEEAIQDAFEDGILWVTLGEDPGDLTPRVNDLICVLSGQRPDFAGLDGATTALAELLADRSVLLVIDDAWDAAHLRPFLQGGPRCARLITTRRTDLLPARSRRIDVDAMAADEAMQLLGQGLPIDEAAGHRLPMAALAARLGEWPLLLKLVNAALRERVLEHQQSLAAALAHVSRALDVKGLTHFDARDAAGRSAAVATTLGVSLAQLDQAQCDRLHELAVFPEDVAVPLDVVAALWAKTANLDAFDTEDLCGRLARLSMLLALDLSARTLRLHDVVRQFLIGRLGSRLAPLHAALLDTGRPAEGGWASLMTAGATGPARPEMADYWWSWLFVHLRAAGRADELRATAFDLRYLAAKSVHRTPLAVEADLALAASLSPDDLVTASLRRGFTQATYALARCVTPAEALATLFGRLCFVPGLGAQIEAQAAGVLGIHLRPLAPPPDLPHPALIRTLGAHQARRSLCALSGDGRRLASADGSGLVRLWDTASGREVVAVKDLPAVALAISRDGGVVAVATKERRLVLLDGASGHELLRLAGHADAITAVALAAEANLALTSSVDGTLRLWRLAGGGEVLHVLGRRWDTRDGGWIVPTRDAGHWSAVLGCAISGDGRWAASASSDQTAVLWDVASGRGLLVLRGHDAVVNACAFSHDGRCLATASADRTVVLWDLGEALARRVAAAEDDPPTLSWQEDARHLRPKAGDRSIRFWDLGEGVTVTGRLLAGHRDAVLALAFSDDDTQLLTASADGTLCLWGSESRRLQLVYTGHTDWVLTCALASAAGLAASASLDGTVRLWEVRGAREVGGAHDSNATDDASTVLESQPWVLACAAVPAQHRLYTTRADRGLVQWDTRLRQRVQVLRGHEAAVRACAVSRDGAWVASAGADRSVILWDAANARAVQTFSGHRDWVNGLCFSPDAGVLASVANDRTVRLWSLPSRARRIAFVGHEHWVNSCAFSADGRWVFTGAADGSLVRWRIPDAEAGEWEAWVGGRAELGPESAAAALRPLPLRHHAQSVNCVRVAPMGESLAAASSDGTVSLWAAASGELLHVLQGHRGEVEGCDFSPDGRLLASASGDGNVRVWSVADGRCLASLHVDGQLASCVWTGVTGELVAAGALGVYFLGLVEPSGLPHAVSPAPDGLVSGSV